MSSVFTVVVGDQDPKTFLLHADLLAQESDRLAKSVSGGFLEQASKKIQLEDEDPELFGFFLAYLYGGDWLDHEVGHSSEYVTLARLYGLAERLQARRFQIAIYVRFTHRFPKSGTDYGDESMPDQYICDLLEVAVTQLPDLKSMDPLQKQIFWLGASKLDRLQEFDVFERLLDLHPYLGKYLCLRAGETDDSPPDRVMRELPARFEPESTFPALSPEMSVSTSDALKGTAQSVEEEE